jgi:NAD(P)-dependent dehydrogenase (short-subunit alcohol dehydrogenase family)
MNQTAPIALVTGAAKRLGRHIALALAQAGWDIVVHYGRAQNEAALLVTEIKALGRKACALQADLSDPGQVATLIERCTTEIGLPECLVNNASMFEYDDAKTFKSSTLQAHMQVNAAAPIALATALHKARCDATHTQTTPGVIINILDQKLANPNPDFLSYTLSKASLQEATRLLAQALAPQLRVVGLAPGLTLVSGDQTEQGFQAAHRQTPLGKSSTPDDIAQAVVYLARAHAVTGTTLFVDGGQHLKPSERDVMFLTS